MQLGATLRLATSYHPTQACREYEHSMMMRMIYVHHHHHNFNFCLSMFVGVWWNLLWADFLDVPLVTKLQPFPNNIIKTHRMFLEAMSDYRVYSSMTDSKQWRKNEKEKKLNEARCKESISCSHLRICCQCWWHTTAAGCHPLACESW